MSAEAAAREAVAVIEDGQTVAILGAGGGVCEPDLLIRALGERFDETGRPVGLTLVHAFGLGGKDDRTGLTPLAKPGLVKRAIGGHWGQTPAMCRLAADEEIEAYNLPLGVMTLLHREIAGGRPGLFSRIGLGTFVDPRIEGGRMNDRTSEPLVDLVDVDGEELLFYRGYRIDVALIRGSVADREGNLSVLGEPALLETLALASAAHSSGGKVIAQVRRQLEEGEWLPPAQVKVPATLVDRVVEFPGQWQTYEAADNAAYAGLERIELGARSPMDLTGRKVIARRAVVLFEPAAIANVGVGVPDGVGRVLAEEGCERDVTLTVEHGIFGGVSASGILFGATMNFDALVDTPDMMNFYHGGGLDLTFLGFAQVDASGNVNVSKYNGQIMGSGGFIDISQSAKKVVFCGTLTTGGLVTEVVDGRLRIDADGSTRKFVSQVDQITFSASEALRRGQEVFYITERAVFQLSETGLALIEVAPGVDVERDVIGRMDFRPEVGPDLKQMDPALFLPSPIGLRERWGSLRSTA